MPQSIFAQQHNIHQPEVRSPLLLQPLPLSTVLSEGISPQNQIAFSAISILCDPGVRGSRDHSEMKSAKGASFSHSEDRHGGFDCYTPLPWKPVHKEMPSVASMDHILRAMGPIFNE